MNMVGLTGRATKKAEVRYSAGEDSKPIARVTLAVNRRYRSENDGQTADFINCVAFGKQAEFLERFGEKGVKFEVRGRIVTGDYTDKDGKRVFTTDVVIEDIDFAESKKSSND